MNRQYGALNGVAIFLIVLNHAIHFGLQAAPVAAPWFAALVVLQALGAFAVPVFLFVSGAFLAYAAKEFSATFVRSSLERILWPYLLWSGIFYTLMYVGAGTLESPAGYAKHLLVGYPYHFVPLLVFWYLVTPGVARVGRRHGLTLVVAIGAWQLWLMAVREPAMFGLDGVLPAWTRATAPPVLANTMADWGVFFPLGFVMSLHGSTVKPHLERWRGVAAALAAALLCLGLLNAASVVPAPWARLVAPLPLMFVLPTINRGAIPLLPWFERLGRRSYGIYLTHFVVINAATLALGGQLWPRQVPALVYPAFLLVALGGSLALMDGLARVEPGRKAYRYLFGITPPARRLQPDPRPARASALHP